VEAEESVREDLESGEKEKEQRRKKKQKKK
jgi:hypothetical protein